MDLLAFWRTKTVEPEAAPPTATDAAGPIEEALDAILDAWAASFSRRPVIHAGLVAMKGLIDVTAPLVRAALAARGIRIVKA